MNLRGHQEHGELSAQSVKRNQSHRDQQHGRNDADEHVRHDQAVAKAPENSPLDPAKSQDEEQDCGDKGEESDPASQVCAPGGSEQSEKFS